MRKRAALILSTLMLLCFVGCDKEEKRVPNFLVKFATVVKTESSIAIELDNGVVLQYVNSSDLKVEEGNRVILNYTPLEDGTIKINSIQKIFLDNIKSEGYSDKLKSDPIKIVSVWVSGNYLNMSFYVDFHSKEHSVALFRDEQADKPTLYFMYSRLDDPPGAPTLRHLSFNLDGLEKEDFAIYINTNKGERRFEHKPK